jgi:hypothetical protein
VGCLLLCYGDEDHIIAIAHEVWKNGYSVSYPYTHNTDKASNPDPSSIDP